MAQLKRKALMHFLDTAWNASVNDASTKATWEILGSDIEDMSTELNPNVERFENILNETKTRDQGYEAAVSADPFYADPDSALYAKLKDIALNRKTGADCKTLYLEVIVDDTSDTAHSAWVSEVLVKPQSYGGDPVGVNFPFEISEDGKRVEGTVTAASVLAGSPVFTAKT